MDNPDIYGRLLSDTPAFTLNLGSILKLPLIIILIGNIFYSLMLILKTKILSDTVDSDGSRKIKVLVYINLFISLITTLLASFLILLG